MTLVVMVTIRSNERQLMYFLSTKTRSILCNDNDSNGAGDDD